MENALNLIEVAERIGVTTVTVLNYINGGKLKASKKLIGLKFKYQISKKDLELFMTKYMS